MNITLFKTINGNDKSHAVEKLITSSTPSQDFYLMVILAVAMATFGLLLDSAAIIIGSMLISPILYSFLSLSLGLCISDKKLMARSFYSIFKATIGGIAISALITLFMAHNGSTSEILSRINPSLAYGAVALIAGFAAAFTLTKQKLNETLPGVAIAVAIIPPVAVSGIGLATLQWSVVRGSFLLFILNTGAVIAGSLIVFSLMNFFAKKNVVKQKLEEEVKEIKKIENKCASLNK